MKVDAHLALAAMAVAAGETYRWTDAKGVVHYSDVPPADKKAHVTPVDTGPALPEVDRQAAAARLASERAYLQKSNAAPAKASVAPSAGLPMAPASSPQTCGEQWRAYNDSSACMAPYHFIGGTRPEGVARCGNVPQPVHCPMSVNPN